MKFPHNIAGNRESEPTQEKKQETTKTSSRLSALSTVLPGDVPSGYFKLVMVILGVASIAFVLGWASLGVSWYYYRETTEMTISTGR